MWSVVSVSCTCLPCQDGRTRNRWCIPKIKPIGKLYVREPPPELSQACLGNRLLLLVLLSLAYLVLLFLIPHCLTGAPLPAAPSSPQETATSTASCCFSSVAAPCLLLAATRRCPVLSLDRVSLRMFWRQRCSAEAGSPRRVSTAQACPSSLKVRWVFGLLSTFRWQVAVFTVPIERVKACEGFSDLWRGPQVLVCGQAGRFDFQGGIPGFLEPARKARAARATGRWYQPVYILPFRPSSCQARCRLGARRPEPALRGARAELLNSFWQKLRILILRYVDIVL